MAGANRFGAWDSLDIAVNRAAHQLSESQLMRTPTKKIKPFKVSNDAISDSYEFLHKALDLYESALHDHSNAMTSVSCYDDMCNELYSILSDGQGDVTQAQSMVRKFRQSHVTPKMKGNIKLGDDIEYNAGQINYMFEYLEMVTAYSVLLDHMPEDDVKKLDREEVIARLPVILEENPRMYVQFRNQRYNAIKKMEKLGLHPSS